jgi:hypothetical protein
MGFSLVTTVVLLRDWPISCPTSSLATESDRNRPPRFGVVGGIVTVPAAPAEVVGRVLARYVPERRGAAVVPLAVVPWRHVWARYVTSPGDRWR